MDKINISSDFDLPLYAVTETFGIVAKRGAGKTYTAKVMVEGMLDANAHVVILDPIGVWWGLRTAADGISPGYPIFVAGGEHGDIQIESTAGAVLADLVMQGHSAILDLSLMRKGEQRRFSTAFLEKLYHNNRHALHLVLEEADMVAPQRPVKGSERLLGAAEDIVRRGRSKGIGVTMITQRPAVINKDVLTQVETLIALRMTGPQDQKAIDAWVQYHGDQDLRKTLMSALPSLPVGEAIIWSPGLLDVFKKVKVRKLKTFDSSKTPKPGSTEASIRAVAEIDIGVLSEQIEQTIEKAEANDPSKLKAKIRQLEKQLKKKPELEKEIIEVSVLTDEDNELLSEVALSLDRKQQYLEEKIKALEDFVSRIESVRLSIKRMDNSHGQAKPVINFPQKQTSEPIGITGKHSVGGISIVDLTGPEARILNALAWLCDTTGRMDQPVAAVAFMAKYKIGGAFNNPKAKLKKKGLIEYAPGGILILTEEGNLAAEHETFAATPEDMHRRVYGNISGPMKRILEPLIEAYPNSIANHDLAVMAGYSPNGGAYNNPRGKLRTCGLIEYQAGEVKASPILFFEGQ